MECQNTHAIEEDKEAPNDTSLILLLVSYTEEGTRTEGDIET